MKTNRNEGLMKALSDCFIACNECAVACLEEQDVDMMRDCIKLDIDCAAICQTLMGFVARSSAHAGHLLKECAELCDLCAMECRKHEHMEHCRRCADACVACADTCRWAATLPV